MSKWENIVMSAWLERNSPKSPHYHPAKAARIGKRFASIIDRAQRRLTAEIMVERYKHSPYTAWERANDHAISHLSTSWQYQYWKDVCEEISRIQKEIKQ